MATSSIQLSPFVKMISKPSTDQLPNSYPMGISLFTTDSNDPIFPSTAGIMTVIPGNYNRAFQIAVGSDNNMRFRRGHISLGWETWKIVSVGGGKSRKIYSSVPLRWAA